MKKVALRFCLLLLAAVQKLPAPDPSVAHCIGLARAPLYRNATDTTGRTTKYLPSPAAAVAVGRLSPGGWLVERAGSRSLTPAGELPKYDPAAALLIGLTAELTGPPIGATRTERRAESLLAELA